MEGNYGFFLELHAPPSVTLLAAKCQRREIDLAWLCDVVVGLEILVS